VPVSVRETDASVSEELPVAIPAFAAANDAAGLAVDAVATPDVVGLSARQALAVFARLGMTARLSGTGFVVSQDPPAGAPARAGETHALRLSETAPPINRPGRGREETSPAPGP
jgi:hypothetical protein